jgi:ATP-citrate lyase beta-subunit
MAQKSIREYAGKNLFAKLWDKYFEGFEYSFESVLVQNGTELQNLAKDENNNWLNTKTLVAKPDMLFGKRGKNDLVLFRDQAVGDVKLEKASTWIDEKASGVTKIYSQFDEAGNPAGNAISGELTHFVVEPFTPHTQEEEYYISATTVGEDDVLYISAEGGMEVEEGWEEKVTEIVIPITMSDDEMEAKVKASIPDTITEKEKFGKFAVAFFKFYRDMNFAYLEINPIVIQGEKVELLDLVARLDDTAGFMMTDTWGDIEYPTAFGMEDQSPEEKAIAEADSKSGASLKLTILNPKGRIWTMVAGGGASVVYADTIADLAGGVEDLANYGEYSGGPTTGETKFYADTVIDLMTRTEDPRGKIMIIGGAIANFTDVAKTFTGIIQSFEENAEKIKAHNTKIYVRRGGPNYEKGLKDIKEAGDRLGLYIEVYGPETHVTDIVRMALEEK